MPFIREPPKLQEVFDLSTPQHMLDKLFWEVDLFKGGLDDPGVFGYRNSGFAAFNCAVTATHCADWAWSSAEQDTREALGVRFGFTVSGNERSDAVAFFDALEKANRDFYICRKLANGAKHMRRGPQPHPVEAVVEFSRRSYETEGRYLVDFVVKDGEVTNLVSDVFSRMCDFWERLYRDIGYLEPLFIEGDRYI
jgi:hypothetical protein